MKRLILPILAILAFAGCATNMTKPALNAHWYQQCVAYKGAQTWLIAHMHKMSTAQFTKFYVATTQITPLCASPPADPVAATKKITAAVTKLTVLEATLGAKK